MATQSLVVSRDPEILSVLGPLMSEFGMEVDVCDALPGAMQSLRDRKYDTVIVDCDQDRNGLDLLMQLREGGQNKKMVAVGITSNLDAKAVFDSGATFVLSKPLPIEDARRILRISHGAITREVRRFMRLPVDTLAVVSVDDRQEAILLNLSQRGLAIQTTESINIGQMVYVSFLLPDSFNLIEGMAQVMWLDPSGRAGLEFRSLDDDAQQGLTKWVFQCARKNNPNLEAPTNWNNLELVEHVEHLADADEVRNIPPVAWAAFEAVIDVGMVTLGTLLFFAFGWIAGQDFNDRNTLLLGMISGLVFLAVYRFLFTFFRVDTPGKHAKRAVKQHI